MTANSDLCNHLQQSGHDYLNKMTPSGWNDCQGCKLISTIRSVCSDLQQYHSTIYHPSSGRSCRALVQRSPRISAAPILSMLGRLHGILQILTTSMHCPSTVYAESMLQHAA